MTLPTGTITFLFTDIEGSTKLWERCPDAMRLALVRHDVLLREVIERHSGHVFKTVGDAFCAAFPTASDALHAALEAHLILHAQEWGETGPIRIRIALHTGEAEERDKDYFGLALNRVARLQSAGHGQQTLLSQATYEIARGRLPRDVTLRDMGMHRLKDLQQPEHVWQLLHPALPSDFPPLKSLDYLPTNLPRQITSFIGREQEMKTIKQLLKSESLITLTGTGGTGKTRLALQVGADLIEDYEEGVWLVELAALADPVLVPKFIATALALREEAGRPILETLLDYLKDRQLLLVLDNCEHLVDACASLADTLLKVCPRITILATSREALGVPGEKTWRVPSLSTPRLDDLPIEEKELAPILMEYDACRLFVERVNAHRPGFALTRQNVPSVADLCRQLDGIPLALELAAARTKALTIEQIVLRLGDRFRLLVGGSRTLLPRQQTLRALIDWSYDLLNDQEKRLLARLSVFSGGWTLEAAEQICGGEGIEPEEVLDLLAALVDKSLIVFDEEEAGGRYRLLETIRQYVQERLTEDETTVLRKRHQEFFLTLAEEADTHFPGPEQEIWLNKLQDEVDNIRAALEWEEAEYCLRLTVAMGWYWNVRGYYSEGQEALSKALSLTTGQGSTLLRARALQSRGVLAWLQGDAATAKTCYEASLEIRRERNDQKGIASSLYNLGILAATQGDYAIAKTRYEESLTIQRELGNKMGISSLIDALGVVAGGQGNYSSARALHHEALRMRRELRDKRGVAMSLNNLGRVLSAQGEYAAARKMFEESVAIKQEFKDRQGIANSLNLLGDAIYHLGEFAAAKALFEQSLALKREVGDKRGIISSLLALGSLAKDQNDDTALHACVQESLTLCQEIGCKHETVGALIETGQLAQRQHQPERAARLYGAARALREQMDAPLTPSEQEEHDRSLAELEALLGKDAFAAAFTEGQAMRFEEAIAYALEEGQL